MTSLSAGARRDGEGSAIVVTSGLLRRWAVPAPDPDDDKLARGTVLAVCGSARVPGAAVLSGIAALRVGAGRLMIATTRSTATAIALAVPEALVAGFEETADGGIAPGAADEIVAMADKCAAVVIGPGMMDRDAVDVLCRDVVGRVRSAAVVLDAAALHVVPELERPAAVLTPNGGELRDLGYDDARSVAAGTGAVVATRGVVAAPDGRSWRHDGGTVGLATSGSGDVLAGAVAGFAARGADPAQAAVWATHVHGRAGERLMSRVGGIGFLARELLDEIPAVIAEIAS